MSRKPNFWSLIWSSFVEIQGALITFIGFFVSILISWFPVKTQIPLGVFIIVTLILLLIIFTVVNAFNKLIVEYLKLQELTNKTLIPRILSARKYKTQAYDGIICLLEKSELFANGAYVSCYYKDEDGFEVTISTGFTTNIQADGKIQVFLNQPVTSYQDILDKLASNDAQIISKVFIKPIVTKNFFENFTYTI